jgi:hypothetical protein
MVQYVLAVAISAVVIVVFLAAINRSGFRLPRFVATTLSAQPSAPRAVKTLSVAVVVAAGLDGVCYTAAGVISTAAGAAILIGVPARLGEPDNIVRPAAESVWVGVVLLVIGLFFLALIGFRIWQVRQALATGAAELAEVTTAEAGLARLRGSLWGDLAWGQAARGSYRMTQSSDTGRYYMQQRWALALQPGMRIWVVRLNGKDILYAPT